MTLRPLFAALLLAGTLQAAPNFAMMGFATVDGGTTGGAGGAVVTPTTLAELKRYAEDKTTPYVIRITKEFNTGVAVKIDASGSINSAGAISTTYGDIIRLGSNKTLVGIGSAAFFNRIGIIIQSQSNIIIRNIRFTMKHVPISRTDENKIVGWVNGAATVMTDPDCIGIQADDETIPAEQRIVRHIWIDHCEFFNEDPSVMTDVDRYDGLVDGKNNSSNITISWCYFHDHHKASLFGKGDSDNFDRRITYSHNHFKNILSRLPLIRYGKVHMLNNLMVTSENGTNARINSDVYIEANHYEASKKPVFGKVSENGAATLVNNKWVDCDRVPQIVLSAAPGASALSASEEILPGSFKPSTFYNYTAFLDAVANVPTVVAANAGVGKISTTEYDAPTSVARTAGSADFATLRDGALVVNAPVGSTVELLGTDGAVLHRSFASSTAHRIALPARSGIVLVRTLRGTQRLLLP